MSLAGLNRIGAAKAGRVHAAAETPPIGTVRQYLALDWVAGRYYLQPLRLRGVGEHIEVWVADDVGFPDSDCRNGARTQIDDAQVNYLVDQFDSNIYPIEKDVYGPRPAGRQQRPVLADR